MNGYAVTIKQSGMSLRVELYEIKSHKTKATLAGHYVRYMTGATVPLRAHDLSCIPCVVAGMIGDKSRRKVELVSTDLDVQGVFPGVQVTDLTISHTI